MALAIGHNQLLITPPLESIETLLEILNHSLDGLFIITTISQFELTPHRHSTLIPRLAGIANAETKLATLNDAIYIINISAAAKCEADCLTLFWNITVASIPVLSRS